MVRLKDIGHIAFYSSNFRFQFLMVRLKAVMISITAMIHPEISIPYGAIKS